MPTSENSLNQLKTHILRFSTESILLLLISIYFSTAVSSILSIIVILVWLVLGYYKHLPNLLKTHPPALWATLVYGYFLLSITYSHATIADISYTLTKYIELLFIPIFIPFLMAPKAHYLAWRIFVAASVLTLLLSYLMAFGCFGEALMLDPSPKSRITHGILIAFFAFYCLHKASRTNLTQKIVFGGLFILCWHNLFFIVNGRTGQFVLVVLVLLFVNQKLSLKQGGITVLTLVVFISLFYCYSEKAQRLHEGVINTQAFFQPIPTQTDSSMGLRYTFWRNSLKLIAERPWFGYGTGGFVEAYNQVKGISPVTKNPHNEFLRITVETGLIGLTVYLAFLLSYIKTAFRLPEPEKLLAQGLITCLVISSIFNSPIMDHTEGHWFALLFALTSSALPQHSSKLALPH